MNRKYKKKMNIKLKKINKVTLFVLITYAISFASVAIFKLVGGNLEDRIAYTIFGASYMFIPMLTAILVKKFIYHEKLNELLISFKINKWFLVAWGLMPLLAFGAFAVSILLPDVSYSPEMTGMFKRFESVLSPEQIEEMRSSLATLSFDLVWIMLIQGLIAGITINAIAGFGEELGWRGFLVKELSEVSFIKASIIIGIIWGIWHAPLILMGHNYPQHPQLGVLMMIIWCTLLTPIFIYITIKAKSVIAAAILHGTLNATAGLAIIKIDGGNDLTIGLTGLAGFVVLVIAIGIFFLYDLKISREKVMMNKLGKYL